MEKKIKNAGHFGKNFTLGFAIFILTMFVVIYGVNTFYEKPEYQDFCTENFNIINNAALCVESGGQWTSYDLYNSPRSVKGELTDEGYCDRDHFCREEYNQERQKYYRNVFLVAIPLGILILVLGAFAFNLNPVGIGLMLGGVGTLIYGAGGYWEFADNWLKFLVSLAGLVAIIWFSYYFNRKK